MKTTRDYSKSPAKNFDAVEDIKTYLGHERWNHLYPLMAAVVNANQFTMMCGIAGIEGFPVEAWYDLYHGQGAFRAELARYEGTRVIGVDEFVEVITR